MWGSDREVRNRTFTGTFEVAPSGRGPDRGDRVFGDIVREHRRRLGLSQQELADKSGVSVRGLRKLESGRIATPRPVTVRLLADVFGLVGAGRDRFCAAAHPQPAGASHRESAPPAQLPPDVCGFTGRADELALLYAVAAVDTQPNSGVVYTVSGTAGVGKTALAVHWAHRVRHRFPDGQLYVNLRGFDPSGTVMAPAEAIRRFLDALGVHSQRMPPDPNARGDLYRTLLADRSMLVVLDNARDPDQVRPLLPGAPGCLVLVTSRNRLSGLVATEGAHPILLDLLTFNEARDLLSRRLGPGRVAAEPAAVDEIIACCDQLPLALSIVAANAATHPQRSLTAFADQLRDSRDRLDALSTNDTLATDVRAVFSWSWRALGKEPARLFRLLGLHPGPDVSAAAAASLAAIPLGQARSMLDHLADTHLIDEHAPGRYTLHDLLREYAADLARATETEEQRHAVTGRMLDHYLHTAYSAARLLNPHREPIALSPPQPGVTVTGLAGHDQAIDWFTAEHRVLLGAIDHAAATGFETHVWQLALTLDIFLNRRGHWRDWAATGRAALAAADRLADPFAQGRAHRNLARACLPLGRLDDARTHLRHALDLFGEAGDRVGQADAHLRLANVGERQGRHAEALDYSRRALHLYRAAGHRLGEALALNAVGWYHAHLGEYRAALPACEQAIALLQELDNRPGQAATWDSLGHAHHYLGHRTQAVASYQHAIDLYRDLGDRYHEAAARAHIGDSHHAAGDADAARTAWRRALTILDQLDHPDAHQVRTKLHGLDQPKG
jgi:tetratricopeptide (TPR) repeat protein/DNA-binding XRE family transcriptional regulator